MSRRDCSRAVATVATVASLVATGVVDERSAAAATEIVMTTVSGAGGGDFGPATKATLLAPVAVVAVPGGMLIADAESHRVRRVDGAVVKPFAGTGAEGRSGDGGPAARAALGTPMGLALDGAGRVLVADKENNVVRRVSAIGVITTVAGGGDPAGESAESLGDGGPATAALLAGPAHAVAGPDGSVYIADTGNGRVRRVDRRGVITTFAGGGEPEGDDDDAGPGDGGPAVAAGLVEPVALAFDASGALYVAERSGHRVRRIDRAGTITTVAGSGDPGFAGDGGAAPQARLNEPGGLAIDASGALLIADTRNHRIRRVSTTGVISTVVGAAPTGCDPEEGACPGGFGGDGGPATAALLNGATGVAVDGAGALLVADTGNRRIRRVTAAGVITSVAGSDGTDVGDGGPAVGATLRAPAGLAVDGSGAVLVADAGQHRIRAIDPTGAIRTVAGNGTTNCPADPPPDGSCPGAFGGDGGPATDAALNSPRGVAVAPDGTIYIADALNNVVRRVSTSGTISTFAGNRANETGGACPSATPASDTAPVAATSTCLAEPSGVAVDAAGNVFVADTRNDRVCKITPTGALTVVAGGSVAEAAAPATATLPAQPVAQAVPLSQPRGVATTGAGDVLIADTGAHRVLKLSATGAVSVVAGTGTAGFGGDGAAATGAQLSSPVGVVVSTSGTYIADSGNDVVRRIDGAGMITTVAGGGSPDDTTVLGDGEEPTAAKLAAPEAAVPVGADRLLITDSGHGRVRAVGAGKPAVTLTLSASPSVVAAGGAVAVRGAVTKANTGAPLGDVQVRVFARPHGALDDVPVRAVRAQADGTFAVTARPSRLSEFVAVVDEGPAYAWAASPRRAVSVRWVLTVSSPKGSSVTIPAGSPLTLKGTVAPAVRGVPVEVLAGTKVLVRGTTGAAGAFAVRVTFRKGRYVVRVRARATPSNAEGLSRDVRVVAS